MNIELTKYIYDKMASHQFVMSVLGNFNQELLKSLIKMTERKLDSLSTDDSIKKKLFHFMVECAQNLCKINDNTDNSNKLFLIGKQNDNYIVYIGSIFGNDQADKIKTIIDTVNKLENGEVKQQFYAELSGKDLEFQDHLLMSLLDISKRTKEKVHYVSSPVGPNSSFLSFKTTISGQISREESAMDVYDLFQTMSTNNIMLFYQGLFDQEMVKSVVSMTEKKLIEDNIDEIIRRRLFNIMVEGMQNICKHQLKEHAVNENPFIIVGKFEDTFSVATGNPIPNEKISIISTRIDQVNALNKDELKEFYKNARLKSVISDVGGAGLGFIDMARKSGNKLEYQFYPLGSDHSFFILNNRINKQQ